MTHLVLIAGFAILGFVLQGMKQIGRWRIPGWSPWVCWVLALVLAFSTSFVVVDQNRIGHLKRR